VVVIDADVVPSNITRYGYAICGDQFLSTKTRGYTGRLMGIASHNAGTIMVRYHDEMGERPKCG
jgi:hypothetical protein